MRVLVGLEQLCGGRVLGTLGERRSGRRRGSERWCVGGVPRRRGRRERLGRQSVAGEAVVAGAGAAWEVVLAPSVGVRGERWTREWW